jgi:hypothetical protein
MISTRLAAPSSGADSSYRIRLVGLTLISYLGLVLWPEFMAAMGIGHAGVWFLDINTLLASNDAIVHGLDPYKPNPLDYVRDSHAYSDWWLQLHHFNLGRKDRLWLGALVNGCFFLTFFWQARAGTFRELLVLWLLILSPPMILGFNRANPDLLVYALLVPVVPLFLSDRWSGRTLAFGLITLAIGLKYYPVIACLVVFFTARSRRDLGLLLLIWAVIGGALAINLSDDFGRATGLITATTGFFTYGAAALAANIGHGMTVMVLGVGLAFVAFIIGWTRPVFQAGGPETAERIYFFLGAALLTGCFFITISYIYRLVFALMLMRWLFAVIRNGNTWERGYGWAVILLGLGVFWADGLMVLAVNMNMNLLTGAELTSVTDLLVIVVHTAGWCWTLLLLAGLGTMGRVAWNYWRPGGTFPDIRS